MTDSEKKRFLLLVLLVTPFSGAAIDIYVPSLPSLVDDLHTTGALARLTIPVFLLGYGLGQPFFGTMSDALGRRPPMLWGLLLFSLTCGLAPFAPDINTLLLLRFFQGLAVAGPAVISKAVITDVYDGEEHRRVTNSKSLVWAMGPVLAPAVGGYLQVFAGWTASFYFLAGTSLLAYLLCLAFWVETHTASKPIAVSEALRLYRIILSSRPFVGALICMSLVASVMAVFNVVSPFLVQVVLGYSPQDYGHLAMVMGLSWWLGTLLSRISEGRTASGRVIALGLWLALACSLVGLGISWHGTTLLSVVMPTIGVYLSAGAAFPNCMGACLKAFPEMAGAASAVMGSLFVLGMALTSGLASATHAGSSLVLYTFYVGLLAAAVLAHFFFLGRGVDRPLMK